MAALLCLLAMVAAGPAGAAQNAVSEAADSNTDKITITSDKLVTHNKDNFAEFTGNVVAEQGASRLTADRLKIYYRAQQDNPQGFAPDQESIQKIVAEGKVIIRMDEKEARTEHAVYTAATGVLILTGAGSRVASGDNYVAGEKITLHRNEDKMTVESAAKQRVEAVFYPGKKGIQ